MLPRIAAECRNCLQGMQPLWASGAHRASTASPASVPQWPQWQHPSKRLSWQPQAATMASVAELISTCNQQGMKGR